GVLALGGVAYLLVGRMIKRRDRWPGWQLSGQGATIATTPAAAGPACPGPGQAHRWPGAGAGAARRCRPPPAAPGLPWRDRPAGGHWRPGGAAAPDRTVRRSR